MNTCTQVSCSTVRHSTEFEIRLDTNPPEAIWLHSENLRLLEKARVYVIIPHFWQLFSLELFQSLEAARVSSIATMVRREIDRDIKSVSHSVLVDQIVTFVNLLFSCFQIEPAQICLYLYVLSN